MRFSNRSMTVVIMNMILFYLLVVSHFYHHSTMISTKLTLYYSFDFIFDVHNSMNILHLAQNCQLCSIIVNFFYLHLDNNVDLKFHYPYCDIVPYRKLREENFEVIEQLLVVFILLVKVNVNLVIFQVCLMIYPFMSTVITKPNFYR